MVRRWLKKKNMQKTYISFHSGVKTNVNYSTVGLKEMAVALGL